MPSVWLFFLSVSSPSEALGFIVKVCWIEGLQRLNLKWGAMFLRDHLMAIPKYYSIYKYVYYIYYIYMCVCVHVVSGSQKTWLRIQSHANIHATWPNYKTRSKQILWNYISSFKEMDWCGYSMQNWEKFKCLLSLSVKSFESRSSLAIHWHHQHGAWVSAKNVDYDLDRPPWPDILQLQQYPRLLEAQDIAWRNSLLPRLQNLREICWRIGKIDIDCEVKILSQHVSIAHWPSCASTGLLDQQFAVTCQVKP